MYGGWVDSTGPRYCPSIEDKIVRFRDKDSHQVSLAVNQACFKQVRSHICCRSQLCRECSTGQRTLHALTQGDYGTSVRCTPNIAASVQPTTVLTQCLLHISIQSAS